MRTTRNETINHTIPEGARIPSVSIVMVVTDVDRPDVGGVRPKMQVIRDRCAEQLGGIVPYLTVSTDDNLCSSVTIRGTFDQDWTNGIFQNGLYFIISIDPERGKRYYADGEKVTVSMNSMNYKLEKKLRKYTGPVDRVITKIADWMDK